MSASAFPSGRNLLGMENLMSKTKRYIDIVAGLLVLATLGLQSSVVFFWSCSAAWPAEDGLSSPAKTEENRVPHARHLSKYFIVHISESPRPNISLE